MQLARLLERLEYEIIQGTKEIEIAGITENSKEITKGNMFVCITGMQFDGCDYIPEAVEKGATTIVVEKKVKIPKGVTGVYVPDTRIALGKLAATFYDNPAKDLTVIGVTGTKGKTTVSYMIYECLKAAGYRTGLIGTIEIQTGKRRIPATRTSPESIMTQRVMREMVESGCKYVVMEVSSQALKLHRVEGIVFDYAIFTNLGIDHIGNAEHVDFEEYKQCKAKLFQQCKVAILNQDDRYWEEMKRNTICKIETFGRNKNADFIITNVEKIQSNRCYGVKFFLNEKEIQLTMPGMFNVYNAAAAYGVCKNIGITDETMQKVFPVIQVCGRVERVNTFPYESFLVLVDYAHNAMSLQSVLEMIHSYNPKRIITIFGCGGGRAKNRRYEMGKVSGQLSDITVLTSDNPRYEDPFQIMWDIREGIEEVRGSYVEIPNRKEAVRYALIHARKGDVILLAGKGHEEYQEIKGIKYNMNDRAIIQEVIKELEYVRRYHY